MALIRSFLSWIALILLLGLTLAVCSWNWKQVFLGGHVYYVDADCYSRMTRVQEVMKHPFTPIRFHSFENAPTGVTPHTTAPLDWVIATLTVAIKPWSPNPLEMAGAFVSPLLAVALVGFLWWWSRKLGLAFRVPLLLTVIFSPILVHGFQLGRPDHQSLILLLVGLAWAAEIALWLRRDRRWHYLSAAAWGFALWTSLYEPAILLSLTLLLRLFVLGRASWPARNPLIVFFAILLGWFLFDGWRGTGLDEKATPYFWRWTQNIGELRHTPVSEFLRWCGLLWPVVPFLLIWRAWREKSRPYLAWALLLIVVSGLCFWHMRWGYFVALAFAFSLPWALAAFHWRAAAWIAFIIALWPIAQEWDGDLFPSEEASRALVENQYDRVLLHDTVPVMKTPGNILAPWWQTPSLVFWTGHPGVGGSSHQSLPGIIDGARFYLSTTPATAEQILRDRQVQWVIAYEPSRIIQNSEQILGVQAVPGTLAERLYYQPSQVPAFLRMVHQNQFFKVYQVEPNSLSPE